MWNGEGAADIDEGSDLSATSRLVEWQVGTEQAGDRLDKAISSYLDDISRSYAAALIEEGAVAVNGVTATKSSQKLKAGDLVRVDIPPPQPSGLVAEDIPLRVVYEDADLLVIDKPAGMVVH